MIEDIRALATDQRKTEQMLSRLARANKRPPATPRLDRIERQLAHLATRLAALERAAKAQSQRNARAWKTLQKAKSPPAK